MTVLDRQTGTVPRRRLHRQLLQPRYLTVEECADLLRVSERTIRELINRGVLPALYVGARIRVKRADIDQHLRTKVTRHD